MMWDVSFDGRKSGVGVTVANVGEALCIRLYRQLDTMHYKGLITLGLKTSTLTHSA